MASYTGVYTNDFGRDFPLAGLPVYSVVDGVRSNTSLGFDLTYLPAIFLDWVSSSSKVSCEIASGTRTIRHAIAYYQSTAYLHIPCPWRGGTPQFQQFFEQLTANASLLTVGLEGERINAWYTDLFTQ